VEIPNGVDTDLFRPLPYDPVVRQRFGIPPEDPVILFVGALDQAHYFKGISLLLEAFSKIVTKAFLLIVGDGEWKSRYQSQAERLGIGRRTIFAGSIPFPELPQFYACSDVMVLPSLSIESFGMVLIEAMACERPVIATDLPGVRSVVTDGREGLLVTPADADALAGGIQNLLDDPRARREMGIRGREKVFTKYAWPKIIPLLTRMYEEVLERQKLPVP
jgi:glycosyltransferase involved in cell wall biosynthesis